MILHDAKTLPVVQQNGFVIMQREMKRITRNAAPHIPNQSTLFMKSTTFITILTESKCACIFITGIIMRLTNCQTRVHFPSVFIYKDVNRKYYCKRDTDGMG